MITHTIQELAPQHSRGDQAFAILYQRHLDWVYSAAKRLLPRDLKHLTPDVTIATFVRLARNARHLIDEPYLLSWLHHTTWRIADKSLAAVGSPAAFPGRELAAALWLLLAKKSEQSELSWHRIGRYLDRAILMINFHPPDKEALLLRFFARKPFAEIGELLGFPEGSVQERIHRSVDRLRRRLGATLPPMETNAFAKLFWENAVQSAPDGVAASIATVLTALKDS